MERARGEVPGLEEGGRLELRSLRPLAGRWRCEPGYRARRSSAASQVLECLQGCSQGGGCC